MIRVRDRTRIALEEMSREDPELAARLVIQTLPAAAKKLDGVSYEMNVRELGTWHVSGDGVTSGPNGRSDFQMDLSAGALAALAAGSSPIGLMLRGQLRIKGKRRRALKLRALADGDDPSIAEALAAGAELDTDAIFRSLAYLIDPEWTRGHSFTVEYDVEGEGRWFVHVRDGERVRVTTEAESMRRHEVDIQGALHAVTLLGRWIERAQGNDDSELAREERQRAVQARRAGSWGGGARPDEPGLMDYEQLYALWERQNWRAHELDFSVDREHWLASPAEAQESMLWSLGSFYIGEERVTADLAPFLLAAPSGEVEIFLATQLVDEARHAAFFDRFGAEVLALEKDDLRGRMLELQQRMEGAWFDVFDDGLRETANRIKANPDDLDLFVEGITTYHMVIEGVLAMTGQRFILKYMEDHSAYPGFTKGFSLVEQDEHRHIAFGVRFLKDMVDSDPRYGDIIMRCIEDLVPRAVHVFKPPYVDSAREFWSYGYHSSQIYGFAYRKLKRRLQVLGLEAPPAEDLMPGPIASPEEARAAGAPV
jgi:ribonucleoside-diphosphate reductase beta chain